jgi:hypothetical protein
MQYQDVLTVVDVAHTLRRLPIALIALYQNQTISMFYYLYQILPVVVP